MNVIARTVKLLRSQKLALTLLVLLAVLAVGGTPLSVEKAEELFSERFGSDQLQPARFLGLVDTYHSLSGLTLGMKNVMGVIGGKRGQIHSGFEDKIVDLTLARPSHLTVMDATRILTAHGPQGGAS